MVLLSVSTVSSGSDLGRTFRTFHHLENPLPPHCDLVVVFAGQTCQYKIVSIYQCSSISVFNVALEGENLLLYSRHVASGTGFCVFLVPIEQTLALCPDLSPSSVALSHRHTEKRSSYFLRSPIKLTLPHTVTIQHVPLLPLRVSSIPRNCLYSGIPLLVDFTKSRPNSRGGGVKYSVVLRESTLVWYGGDKADGVPKLEVGCVWFLTRATWELQDVQRPITVTSTTNLIELPAQVVSTAEVFQRIVTAALGDSCRILVVLLLIGADSSYCV